MTDRTVLAPSISALGGAARRLSSLQITTDTYIQISAESPDVTVYFTTDGTDPRPPGHRITHSASGETHRYQAPFKLNAGLSRIVSAVAVSSRGRLGAMTTELFDVKDVNRYSHAGLEDDSSIILSDVDSFVSTNTYTLNDRITRQPSPSTGDDITEISVSDIYFSPRGKVYSRRPNTARELDTYFEANHPRVIGGYRGRTGQVWEEEVEDGWTSSESDIDSEVTNYFRMARRQQNNNRTRSHSRSRSRERRKSPYLKDGYPEFFTDNSQSHHRYESPRSVLRGRLSPASLLENSKRTHFLDSTHEVYSPRVGTYTDRTYTVTDHKTAIMPEAVMPRSEKEEGRHTPLSDIGYKLGYKFASGDISDISDDVAERHLSARSENEKVTASRNGDKENRKVTRDKPMRKKWSKTGLRETMATDDDVTSSTSSSSGSRSAKYDRKNAKKHHNQAVKKTAAAKVPDAVATPGGNSLKDSNPAMNFVNDSGTQINFWGVEPGDALQQMGTNLQTLMERRQQSRVDERRVVPVETGQSSENSLVDEVTDSVAPPVAKTDQVAQHSIGDKFRNFFGMGSKSKSKQKRSKQKSKGQGDRDIDEPYEKIKQMCLEEGCLWEDPNFPACDESLYFQEKPSVWPVEWKRPHEICSDPLLFVEGASRFDVIQGILGNCWLLAAVASLSSIETLLHQVVPPDQEFQKDYAGVFRFRFWQYGQWVDVCVDDRLPTKNGQLIYMHSRQTNEFWTPLLEKAYAKMNTCYETLSGGLTSEAMTDFTGGVVEKFNFRDELPSNMFPIMLKACERGSLLGCSIDAGGQMEEELDNGLLRGHAYTITAVRVFSGQNLHPEQVGTKIGSEELVRIRNPWGNECEWKGAWSDKSREWQNLSNKDKESLGLTFDHDGEFWMSYRDFSTHFQRVEICNIQPDSLGETEGPKKCWEYSIKEGSWKRKVNAGGCRNSPATFWINPQFRVGIVDADDDDDEDVGTVIIGLMQRSRRRLRSQGYNNLTIGYEVYEVPQERENSPLDQQFFKRSQPVTSSPTYINTREVCGRHRLPPGQYCIIPTTFEADEEADFIIRLFSEKPNDLIEADEKTGVVQAKREAPVNSAPNSHLRSEAETKFKHYGGEDLEVDAFELQKILNSVFTKDFKFGSFDINLCRSIVALEDTDQTGRLSLDEFLQVWNLLHTWKVIYKQYDKDQSGAFNSYELREALKAAGYKLSNSAFNTAVMRYSDKQGSIKFNDFVSCVVRLKTLFDVFSNASDGESAKFSLDDFIKMALYS